MQQPCRAEDDESLSKDGWVSTGRKVGLFPYLLLSPMSLSFCCCCCYYYYYCCCCCAGEMFDGLREEASAHARMRNLHFRLATAAYNSGNGALAKQHSRVGREHDAEMRRLNKQAAEATFQARNKHFYQMRTGQLVENVVDLHGLLPSEAVELLRGLLINTISDHGLLSSPLPPSVNRPISRSRSHQTACSLSSSEPGTTLALGSTSCRTRYASSWTRMGSSTRTAARTEWAAC